MAFAFPPSDARKSYLWSTLGITASTFNLGALAFWMPTFLTRARVLLGLPCPDGSCLSTDRCSSLRHVSLRRPTQTSTSSVLRLQLRLRSGDHSDGGSGRVDRQPLVSTAAGQVSSRGPPHLRGGPAGIRALLHRLHIHGVQQHRHRLRKTNKSSRPDLGLVMNA